MPKPNFFQSLGFALTGIIKCIKKERNLKIHIAMFVLATSLGAFFSISKNEWLVLFLLFAIIISAEICNSAIESICDLIRDKFNLKYSDTTFTRDASAGAVLVLTTFSVIIGLLIFLPYLF